MKNLLQSLSLLAVVILAVFAIGSSLDGNQENKPFIPGKIINNIKKISEEINSIKLTKNFEDVSIFKFKPNPGYSKQQNEVLKKASNLSINKEALKNILSFPKENIVFKIPVSGAGYIELELTRNKVFSGDAKFSTISPSGKSPYNYVPGIYYKGIIKGDNNSLAAISIFENNVIGIISDRDGNYTLGKIDNKPNGASEDYVYYKESDLKIKNKFVCKVNDYDEKIAKTTQKAIRNLAKVKENNPDYVNSTLPIKVYFEADYSMYQKYNLYPRHVYDVLAAEFNFINVLYQNEQIPIEMSEVGVWTSIDPYEFYNDSYSILLEFGANNRDNFYANIGQLVSVGHDQILGGIAWINVLCQPYNPQDSSGRFSFANIDTLIWGYPSYTWDVEVMTHEMGHNIGSRHTHACVWPTAPGVIGAIDSCYYAEGNCFSQTQPNYNGTIMSYCHLNGAINFALGFGPLPGDTIRYTYSLAGCLFSYIHSSELPNTFELMQNFPNPFNPVTKIGYAVPKDAYITLKIYDITGREIASLVNHRFYSAGFYNVSFSASDYSLASGVYFYKLAAFDASNPQSNLFTQVKKMILTK